jgi:hydroxyacylglutathione hydrolase
LGSISYFVESGDDRVVFTGDTLFIAGCGRFFEGTGADMYNSLCKVLGSLPSDTKVYPGHEYTLQNLKFAHHVEPHNEAIRKKLQEVTDIREKGLNTVPSSISEEKDINPFMRVQ